MEVDLRDSGILWAPRRPRYHVLAARDPNEGMVPHNSRKTHRRAPCYGQQHWHSYSKVQAASGIVCLPRPSSLCFMHILFFICLLQRGNFQVRDAVILPSILKETQLICLLLQFWRVPCNLLRVFADSRSVALHACVRHSSGLHCPRRVSPLSKAKENARRQTKPPCFYIDVEIPIDTCRILGNRFPRHRILLAVAFILPSLMGNIMLWKTSRDNKAALLAGLYIVGLSSNPHPRLSCAVFLNTLMCTRANIKKTLVNSPPRSTAPSFSTILSSQPI
jgi:hypothetical protein